MSKKIKAVWFNLDSLIDPHFFDSYPDPKDCVEEPWKGGGRIPFYGAPDAGKGHLALADNGWKNQVTMYALQGLVNRSGPRLMVDTQFWNWQPADQTWRDYYAKSKGIEYETLEDMWQVIDRFRDVIKGLVVHDPDVEQTLYAAVTLAGLEDLLPVKPEVAEKLLKKYPDLKIVENYVGRWKDEYAPLDFMIAELLPRCERGMILSVDNLWTGMSIHTIDLAVARKAFVYRCSTRHDKYPEDSARIWKIHELAGPNCGVYGWGEPEDKYCEMASLNSNYIMCTEAPNLSFHSKVPIEMKEFRQKSHLEPEEAKLEEDKIYVAFMTTEGDAMKIHMAFQGGAWMDEERGTVPINWGFQPRMLEVAPAMAEYYYSTMTEKDHFFCGCSGAGYTYPNWMPEPERFMRETDGFMKRADIQTMDCWINFSRPVYEFYAKCSPNTKAFILPCGPGQVKMTEAGTPIILRYGGLHYFPNRKTAEELAEAIERAAGTVEKKPAFLTVFVVPDAKNNPSSQGGFCPEDFRKITEILGNKGYKFVTLNEMAYAAKQYAEKYPDRVNRTVSKDRRTRIGVNVIEE